MPALFSYGTIQEASVQLKIIGRSLKGQSDAVTGFDLSDILIGDIPYPILMPQPDSETAISGSVFIVSDKELLAFDEYEGSAYKRSLIALQSGSEAWVYHQ